VQNLVNATAGAAGGGDGDEGFWRLQYDHLSAALARSDLSWESARVYLALGYLGIGFRKEKGVVSLGQISELAHVEHRNTVRALRRLRELGMYDEKKIGPRKIIRWIIWPAPKPQ
jgi:Fic family protein